MPPPTRLLGSRNTAHARVYSSRPTVISRYSLKVTSALRQVILAAIV